MAKHRILLKTDDQLTGMGLAAIVKTQLDVATEIHTVHSFDGIMKELATNNFTLLIAELRLAVTAAHLHKMEALLKSGQKRGTKLLLISEPLDTAVCRWHYRLGVLGIIHTNCKLKEMERAVTKVYQGENYIDNGLLTQMINEDLTPPVHRAAELTA
jgi:DNA-binding NarL/FixJ family response regulator